MLELSILHSQRAVDSEFSEKLDSTIWYKLTFVLRDALVTFLSEEFKSCRSRVILRLSGISLSHCVCSNGYVTFVLEKAFSIFDDDLANRCIEDFRSSTVFVEDLRDLPTLLTYWLLLMES